MERILLIAISRSWAKALHDTATQYNIDLEDRDVREETDGSESDSMPLRSAVDYILQLYIDGLRVPSMTEVEASPESPSLHDAAGPMEMEPPVLKKVHKYKRKHCRPRATKPKKKVASKGLPIQDLVGPSHRKARIHDAYTDGYVDGDTASVSDDGIACCRDVANTACVNGVIAEGECSPKDNGEGNQADLATKEPARQVTQCRDSCDEGHGT